MSVSSPSHLLQARRIPFRPYVVQPGETVYDIAMEHGLTMTSILRINKMSFHKCQLNVGQVIRLPIEGEVTQVIPPGIYSPHVLSSLPGKGTNLSSSSPFPRPPTPPDLSWSAPVPAVAPNSTVVGINPLGLDRSPSSLSMALIVGTSVAALVTLTPMIQEFLGKVFSSPLLLKDTPATLVSFFAVAKERLASIVASLLSLFSSLREKSRAKNLQADEKYDDDDDDGGGPVTPSSDGDDDDEEEEEEESDPTGLLERLTSQVSKLSTKVESTMAALPPLSESTTPRDDPPPSPWCHREEDEDKDRDDEDEDDGGAHGESVVTPAERVRAALAAQRQELRDGDDPKVNPGGNIDGDDVHQGPSPLAMNLNLTATMMDTTFSAPGEKRDAHLLQLLEAKAWAVEGPVGERLRRVLHDVNVAKERIDSVMMVSETVETSATTTRDHHHVEANDGGDIREQQEQHCAYDGWYGVEEEEEEPNSSHVTSEPESLLTSSSLLLPLSHHHIQSHQQEQPPRRSGVGDGSDYRFKKQDLNRLALLWMLMDSNPIDSTA